MTASITQAKGAAPKRAAAKPKRSKAFKRENRTGWAFMAPFAILFAFVFLLPIIWAVYSSFFRQVSQGGGLYGGGELVNEFVGFRTSNTSSLPDKFWTGIGHVLLYTVIQVPIMIIAALALAMVIDSFVVKHVTGFRLATSCPTPSPASSPPSSGSTCTTAKSRRSSRDLPPSASMWTSSTRTSCSARWPTSPHGPSPATTC